MSQANTALARRIEKILMPKQSATRARLEPEIRALYRELGEEPKECSHAEKAHLARELNAMATDHNLDRFGPFVNAVESAVSKVASGLSPTSKVAIGAGFVLSAGLAVASLRGCLREAHAEIVSALCDTRAAFAFDPMAEVASRAAKSLSERKPCPRHA